MESDIELKRRTWREYAKKKYWGNPEKHRKQKRVSQKNNQDKEKARKKKWWAKWSKTPEGRIRSNCRDRLKKFLKGKINREKTSTMIGCSLGFLKNHLEAQFKEGMNWEDYGNVWHIDHIIPLSWFPLTEEWMAVAFHWTNLQPMWASENRKKEARYAS